MLDSNNVKHLTVHKKSILDRNIWNDLTVFRKRKKWAQDRFKMLSTKCAYKIYITQSVGAIEYTDCFSAER